MFFIGACKHSVGISISQVRYALKHVADNYGLYASKEKKISLRNILLRSIANNSPLWFNILEFNKIDNIEQTRGSNPNQQSQLLININQQRIGVIWLFGG